MSDCTMSDCTMQATSMTRRTFLNAMAGLPLALASLALAPKEALALDIGPNSSLMGMGPKTAAAAKALAKKVGAKRVKNKTFPTFCAKGKKMTIAVNAGARYPKTYVLVRNTGNKKVSLLGVKIGMSKKNAMSKLASKGLQTFDGGKTFWWGDAAKLKLTYKGGKVSAFEYRCAPTC